MTDDVTSPQKHQTLKDRGNTLSSRGVHQDTIREALKEEVSQGDVMAWALSHSHFASTEMLAITAMVMSLMQTDADADGRGDAGDAVDKGVGGNGNKEDEDLGGDGDGDVVNQSHMTAPHERKTIGHKKQHKRKALPNLDWHLAVFVYKALPADGDNWKGCQCQVLDDLYGNY